MEIKKKKILIPSAHIVQGLSVKYEKVVMINDRGLPVAVNVIKFRKFQMTTFIFSLRKMI